MNKSLPSILSKKRIIIKKNRPLHIITSAQKYDIIKIVNANYSGGGQNKSCYRHHQTILTALRINFPLFSQHKQACHSSSKQTEGSHNSGAGRARTSFGCRRRSCGSCSCSACRSSGRASGLCCKRRES